jgi:protein ImuA
MAATAGARAALARLRRDIADIEGRSAAADRLVLDSRAFAGSSGGEQAEAAATGFKPRPRRGRLRLGHARLDAALEGGLPLATLHEIRVGESRDGGAAAGFAMALLARLAEAGGVASVVWISEADARREAGALYAPGLSALGLDPGRIVEVTARNETEALWAFEAALACRGLGVAVCELRRPSLALGATRRCALRAREAGVTGLLLRLAGRAEPSAAELRFRAAPAPAGTIGGFARGVGRMAWRLALEKSRNGRTGEFTVEWNAYERSFAEPAERRRADFEPRVAAPLHRPADPGGTGGEGGWPDLRRAS